MKERKKHGCGAKKTGFQGPLGGGGGGGRGGELEYRRTSSRLDKIPTAGLGRAVRTDR